MNDPIAACHAYMFASDATAIDALIADDGAFRSPAVHTPQGGKAMTSKGLGAAAIVCGEGFRYVGERRAETSAVLGHRNDSGRIVGFKGDDPADKGAERGDSAHGRRLA